MASVADSVASNNNTSAGDAAAEPGAAGDADICGVAQPLYPPAPMIGHLTNDEIDALNDVFSRMEMFEAEETARIRYRHTFSLSVCQHVA